MIAFLARAGRAVLGVVAVAAGIAAVGLVDNDRVSNWLVVGLAVLALIAGGAWYWTGLISRGRAPLDRTDPHRITIPGGQIGATLGYGSPDLTDVTVYPADGGRPLWLGTVTVRDYSLLCNALDAQHLRARACLMGGLMGGVR